MSKEENMYVIVDGDAEIGNIEITNRFEEIRVAYTFNEQVDSENALVKLVEILKGEIPQKFPDAKKLSIRVGLDDSTCQKVLKKMNFLEYQVLEKKI